jgi:uncharacterized protein YndB with AHSA1/START domain
MQESLHHFVRKFLTMEKQIIRIEETFNAPMNKVWTALTDKDEMKRWYFDLAEFRPVPGFQFRFNGGPSPEKQYVHLCEVIEADPPRKLSYTWQYRGYPGVSLLSFELFAEGNKTRLVLRHSGIPDFPADNPDFAIENFEKGWDMIIHTNMKQYLEGGGQ